MAHLVKRLVPLALLLGGLFLLSLPQVLSPTAYIDPSTPRIQAAIHEVQNASHADTDYDRILNTALLVHAVVKYGDAENCTAQTAEDVLAAGTGNCVGTTKVVAAMLTGMKIPVLIMEGCALPYDRAWQIPIDPSAKRFTMTGTKRDTGQLHSWLRAYDGHTWYTVETTAGVVFPSTNEPSYGYNTFGGYVDPADGDHLCYLYDPKYTDFCMEATP